MKLIKSVWYAMTMVIVAICCLITASYAYFNPALRIDVSIGEDSISVGDTAQINIEVKNGAPYAVIATNPVVTVQMPAGSSDYSSADCVPTDQTTLACTLAEIGFDEVAQVSISATFNNGGHYVVEASVVADDLLGDIEIDSDLVTVLTQSLNSDPVDLGIEVNGSGGDNEITILGSANVSTVVKNSHATNTVLFPIVELTMSEELEFYTGDYCSDTFGVFSCTTSGDYCSDVDGVLTCKVPTLAPQSQAVLLIEVIGSTFTEAATLGLAATSLQAETQPEDNSAELAFSVVAQEILCGASNPMCTGGVDNSNETEESVSESSSGSEDPVDTNDEQVEEVATNPGIAAGQSVGSATSSGGGVMFEQLLCLLMLSLCRVHVRRNRSNF